MLTKFVHISLSESEDDVLNKKNEKRLQFPNKRNMSFAFHNGHGSAKGEMKEMNHNKKAKKTKKVRYVLKLIY